MTMKKKRSGNRHHRSRGKFGLIGGLVLIVVIVGGYTLHHHNEKPADQPKTPTELAGRWQRSDGGYVLELTGIGPEGQVEAAYFNPRPINVSRSQWRKKVDRLEVFVELRDVNYPGSTYTLVYQPEKKRLYGVYYQAAMGQMFEVEFLRSK